MGKNPGYHSKELSIRWLGTGGFEIKTSSETILVDPYLSRFSIKQIIFQRLVSDTARINQMIFICDHILVTHSHFDHISDVPAIAKLTGAHVLSPEIGCEILLRLGVKQERIEKIEDFKRITLGQVKVLPIPGKHLTVSNKLKEPLWLPKKGRYPMRSLNYPMDKNFSFLMDFLDISILNWTSEDISHLPHADVLLIKPQTDTVYQAVSQIKPGLIIPIHWDAFWKKKEKPMPLTYYKRKPAFKALDWNDFHKNITQISPNSKILIPQMGRRYKI